MKIRYFFFLGFADLAAAELAFLSHPLTNRAMAAPRFADNLPRASPRLMAARTSFFNPRICFCNAFILALAAELAEDFFLAAGRFLAAGLAAFFLTAGRVAFFLAAGRALVRLLGGSRSRAQQYSADHDRYPSSRPSFGLRLSSPDIAGPG